MRRTASRPIPRGQRSPREALAFGLVLGIAATVGCAVTVNVTAAALLAFTIAYYAIVYTAWLKRRSPESIVIGGAAGALPPVIGWAATGSAFSSEPLLLFLATFLWTPPHFWALALERSADYARAGVPALPVVAGREEPSDGSCATACCWSCPRRCPGRWDTPGPSMRRRRPCWGSCSWDLPSRSVPVSRDLKRASCSPSRSSISSHCLRPSLSTRQCAPNGLRALKSRQPSP
jgi:hypothetical protein